MLDCAQTHGVCPSGSLVILGASCPRMDRREQVARGKHRSRFHDGGDGALTRSARQSTAANSQTQALQAAAAAPPDAVPAPPWRTTDWRLACAVCGGSAVIAFVVYLRTLAPSIPT